MKEDYIPPFPARSDHALTIMELYSRARENLLSIWTTSDFEKPTLRTRLLGKTIFVANSPDMVRQVFVKSKENFERKSNLMRRAIKPLVGDGLFISDGETWRSRRRIVGSAIHGSRVPGFMPLMLDAIVELRTQWTKQLTVENESPPFDLLSEMTKLTAEILSRSIFGSPLGKEHALRVAEGFSTYQKNIGAFNVLTLLGLPNALTYLFTRGVRKSAKQVGDVLDALVKRHLEQSEDEEPSFLKLLSKPNQSKEKSLDWKAIRDEAAVIFMAGHETTANCLAWAWFLLSQSPHAEQCLHQEIDSVLNGRLPTISDVPKLVYTRAIIEETLRLYPPIPILSRQSTKSEQIGEHFIPKGALLLVVPWLLHRHRLFWEKPDHFIPERFLPDATPPDNYLYIPFSVGPRVCAGMTFGLTEAILSLAVLSQTLTFRLAKNTSIQAVSHLSLRPDNGFGQLPMVMQMRDLKCTPSIVSPVQSTSTRCPFSALQV